MIEVIEICCDGLEAACDALSRGARRIELCSELSIGGITPSYDDIRSISKYCLGSGTPGPAPVNVLVRPRGGDFVYSAFEGEKMMREIAYCGLAGMNGVVVGALTQGGAVDMPLCGEMVAMARSYGMSVTFHRAIDEAADIFAALGQVLELGVDRVLTSGGAETALLGSATIASMASMASEWAAADPSRRAPVIMPGCGITLENAAEIVRTTGASEIHGSRISLLELA